MKNFMRSFFVFLGFVSLFSFCSCSRRKMEVAKFDGGAVSLSELLSVVEQLGEKEKNNLKTKEQCYQFVRKIALEQILLKEVFHKGMDQLPEIQENLDSIRRNVAFNVLHEKNVLQKLKVVERDYEKYTDIYELYHIVRRTDTLDEKKVENSRKLLGEISSQIKTLDDFKKYAEKYSEDATAYDGGFLGNIRLGIMDEAIDQAMIKLKPGELSGVIETYAGLHLLWVNAIKKIAIQELLTDRKLYDAIYHQKQEYLENEWYGKLSQAKGLEVKYDSLETAQPEDVIIAYENKTITWEEIVRRVEELRQNVFPNPSTEELKRLVKDMAAKLVLEEKMKAPSLLGSQEYQRKLKNRTDYYLMNEYIERNKEIKNITLQDIQKFYQENKATLFTFKMENGQNYVQPLEEVKKFIEQKLETEQGQEARYDLYRKITNEFHLTISEEGVELFRKTVGRDTE